MDIDPRIIASLKASMNEEQQELRIAEHKKASDNLMAFIRNIYLSAIDAGYTDEQAFMFSYATYLNQLQQIQVVQGQQSHQQFKKSKGKDDKNNGTDGKKRHGETI